MPGDPFSFIPCTNATVPPLLEDDKPQETWAALFDPKPEHWSWGNSTEHDIDPRDPYAGRGIYLCGYLDVPLDYFNDSDTRIVRLAVNKFQTSGLACRGCTHASGNAGRKSERTIVMEPGGPGGSGTLSLWMGGEATSRRLSNGTFDTLAWDPRGVNTSLPSASCYPSDVSRDHWKLLTLAYRETSIPSPMSQLRAMDAMHNATFYACKQRLGDLGNFVSTASVARDLEEIRKAMGEDQLTGNFISYGTGIGQTYANMFPDRIGNLILDGTEYVKDHRLLGGFGWTALDNGTDAWREGFLGECLKAGPEHCELAKPANGHTGPVTLEDLERRMEALLTSLISSPVPGYTEATGPSLVTYARLVGALYQAMYNPGEWPDTAQMLFELERGNSTPAAAHLEQDWASDQGKQPSSEELELLVICADSYDAPQPIDGLNWWNELWANMTSKSWIAGNSRFQAVFPCRHYNDYWTPAEVYRGDLNHTLSNPVLLIAESHDPATPLRNGRRLLEEMGDNARLVVHHGYGHSSKRDLSSCTDAVARAYIMNGTLPDEKETHCYADKKPYL